MMKIRQGHPTKQQLEEWELSEILSVKVDQCLKAKNQLDSAKVPEDQTWKKVLQKQWKEN
jgi:hypothetical protein